MNSQPWIIRILCSAFGIFPLRKKSIILSMLWNTERKSHSMSTADGIVGFSRFFLFINSSYCYMSSEWLWWQVCTWKRNTKALTKAAHEDTFEEMLLPGTPSTQRHPSVSKRPFILSLSLSSKYNKNEHPRRYSWSPGGPRFWIKSVLENKEVGEKQRTFTVMSAHLPNSTRSAPWGIWHSKDNQGAPEKGAKHLQWDPTPGGCQTPWK